MVYMCLCMFFYSYTEARVCSAMRSCCRARQTRCTVTRAFRQCPCVVVFAREAWAVACPRHCVEARRRPWSVRLQGTAGDLGTGLHVFYVSCAAETSWASTGSAPSCAWGPSACSAGGGLAPGRVGISRVGGEEATVCSPAAHGGSGPSPLPHALTEPSLWLVPPDTPSSVSHGKSRARLVTAGASGRLGGGQGA